MKKSFLPLLLFLLFFGAFVNAQSGPFVLIAYYSESGNTKAMADAVAEGVRSVEGIECVLKSMDDIREEELLEAGAIIVGSPVYNANLAPPVQEFINSWPFEDRPLKNKIGAAFATGGGISIGEEAVLLGILRSMLIHGMIVVGGEEVEAAFGASAITEEGPFGGGEIHELFLKKAEGLGKRVGELLSDFHSKK
ncbi:flavodoxin family protein [Negadavirga shengliensis]|uniref:Flavodoxin family protein n=1 Tax=Negadavirga shengliensis TaxID=1389218 RepID=A0ABV9T6U6_9BACT